MYILPACMHFLECIHVFWDRLALPIYRNCLETTMVIIFWEFMKVFSQGALYSYTGNKDGNPIYVTPTLTLILTLNASISCAQWWTNFFAIFMPLQMMFNR